MSSEKGYIYVASVSKAYYTAAINSVISLRDYYPDANIALFTHPQFLEDKDKSLFNYVFTDIPVHKRAKMFAMARTPFQTTLYLDCDTEIRSKRIQEPLDFLEDNDIMFTKIIPHVSATTRIDNDNYLEYHGGIILYNARPLTLRLIGEWYDRYVEQIEIKDWENGPYQQYDRKMQAWDQFTLWYLLRQPDFINIRHKLFPANGYSFNYIYLLENPAYHPLNEQFKNIEQVIYHYTIPREQVELDKL